jgi:hypothetical protein
MQRSMVLAAPLRPPVYSCSAFVTRRVVGVRTQSLARVRVGACGAAPLWHHPTCRAEGWSTKGRSAHALVPTPASGVHGAAARQPVQPGARLAVQCSTAVAFRERRGTTLYGIFRSGNFPSGPVPRAKSVLASRGGRRIHVPSTGHAWRAL